MLSNIIKNNLLLCKSILLKRYITSQVTFNIRNKWNMVSSKDQSTTSEPEDDDETNRPIKYSTSKAAAMRIDEYRDPYGDTVPWYQGYVVSLSLAVFLGYFCILREENDIDLLLYTDLEDSLSKAQKNLTKDNIKS
ncbi:hypothetical protein P5V15_009928 [Pogonomyrmex californicus]